MDYRKYLTENLTPTETAILETLILQNENHLKKLREDKSVHKKDLILYLRLHYGIHIDERTLREKIRLMFQKGIPVGGHSGKAGYYVLEEEEIQRIINEDRSRCRCLLDHAHSGDKMLSRRR